MELKDFAKVDENGALSLDNEGFNKAMSSFVDASIGAAVEKAKTNWEKKANDAKLSAEEKFAKEKEEFLAYMKTEKANINKEKARAKLAGKNFTEKEIETMLSNISDNEESLGYVDVFVEQRDKVLADYKQKILEEMQTKKTPSNNTVIEVNQPSQDKKVLRQQDILNKYKK